MPAQLVQTALAEWREGERLLRELPRVAPDHETVRLAVVELRQTYEELTQTREATPAQLARCGAKIESARRVLAASRRRLDRQRPS